MVLFCKYGFVIVVIVKNSLSFGILRADLLKKTKKYIKKSFCLNQDSNLHYQCQSRKMIVRLRPLGHAANMKDCSVEFLVICLT